MISTLIRHTFNSRLLCDQYHITYGNGGIALMIEVRFIEDGTTCTTKMYEENPAKYRGLINCSVCGEKAWFIKGFETPKINRMACFASHHTKEGETCSAATMILSTDDDADQGAQTESPSSDIRIDLDRAGLQNIYVSTDNNKHGEEDSSWESKQQNQKGSGSSGFAVNKTLRQLLSNLCKNPNYANKGQKIEIIANSGVPIIDGVLGDYLVNFKDIQRKHSGNRFIFWGNINNLNENEDGTLWLNSGDYRKDPSIIMDSSMRLDLIRNFKLKDVGELDGSDVILVGNVAFSPSGKARLKVAFTKYISFRRYTAESIF